MGPIDYRTRNEMWFWWVVIILMLLGISQLVEILLWLLIHVEVRVIP